VARCAKFGRSMSVMVSADSGAGMDTLLEVLGYCLSSLAAIGCFAAAAAVSKPGVSAEWCSHGRSDR